MPDKVEPSDPTVKTTILPLVDLTPPSPEIKVEPPDEPPPVLPKCCPMPMLPPMVPECALVPLSDLAPSLLGAFAIGGLTALLVVYFSRGQVKEA